jgi:hypothetical protein
MIEIKKMWVAKRSISLNPKQIKQFNYDIKSIYDVMSSHTLTFVENTRALTVTYCKKTDELGVQIKDRMGIIDKSIVRR